MGRRKHLIVGCGPAAISAVKQMRKLGSEDEILLVTMEKYRPYSPMSLPYLVSGRAEEKDIWLTGEGFFQEMDVTVLNGKRVSAVDPRRKRVFFSDGESDGYDCLLIATGSEPTLQQVLKEAGIQGFHTLDDVPCLKGLEERSHIAILGAGFVGLELAVALAERRHEVTVIAPRERILRRYFDPEADVHVIELLRAHGISVHLSWGEVSTVERGREGCRAVFGSGKKIEPRMLVAATGVVPRLSCLDGSGIEVRQGVVVDRTMRSSAPEVFAAGDVAEAQDLLTGEHGLSLIHPTAVEQGKVAGSNMAGKEAIYAGWLSMNVFNFFGHLAVSLGSSTRLEGDEVLVENDSSEGRYKRITCRGGCLVGANFFNVEVDGGVLGYLMRNKIPLGPHKELFLRAPKDAALWLMLEAEKRSTVSLEA